MPSGIGTWIATRTYRPFAPELFQAECCGKLFFSRISLMAAHDFQHALKQFGQDAEIRRDGAPVTKTKALVRDKQPCLEFAVGTDIQAGDEVFLVLSEQLYAIERVEKYVFGNELHKLKAHYAAPPRHGQPAMVVHGSIINAQSISGSALQFHSPGATQTLTINEGSYQADKVKEAIRLILEILDELDLPTAEKEEARSEAETAEAQLNSPKPRWEWIKTSLSNLRDKVVAGVTEKVVPAVAAKAERAIEWITGTSNTGG